MLGGWKSLSLGLYRCLASASHPGEEERSTWPTLACTILGDKLAGSPHSWPQHPHPAGDRWSLRKFLPLLLSSQSPTFSNYQVCSGHYRQWVGGSEAAPEQPLKEQHVDFTASPRIPPEAISFVGEGRALLTRPAPPPPPPPQKDTLRPRKD